MTTSTPAQRTHFHFSTAMAKVLDRESIPELTTQFILAGEHQQAYELLEIRNELSQVIEVVRHIETHYPNNYSNISGQDLQLIIEGFAPYAAKAFLALTRMDFPLDMSPWVDCSAPFTAALLKNLPQGAFAKALSQTLPSSFFTRYNVGWHDARAAFAHAPGLLEQTIDLWSNMIAQDPQKAPKGYKKTFGCPGLNVAASLGDTEQFERCLAICVKHGAHTSTAVAHRWTDYQQRYFDAPYNENNTLEEALVAGHPAMLKTILEINPTLDLTEEVERVEEICSIFKREHSNTDEHSHYDRLVQIAQATAESYELTQVTQTPKTRPAKTPGSKTL